LEDGLCNYCDKSTGSAAIGGKKPLRNATVSNLLNKIQDWKRLGQEDEKETIETSETENPNTWCFDGRRICL
jgi:hypothetical protein